MPSFISYVFAFALGGCLYPLLELAFRRYSHWSMSLAGGLSLAAIHLIGRLLPNLPLLFQCLLSAVMITEIELIIGCAVNRKGRVTVWDYSHLPFHFRGQICLGYFLLWIALSLPALLLSNAITLWLG